MLGEEAATEERGEALEKALLFMINGCIESGMVRRDEIVNRLENIIQYIERGNLKARLKSV